jgi:hypothetical protein
MILDGWVCGLINFDASELSGMILTPIFIRAAFTSDREIFSDTEGYKLSLKYWIRKRHFVLQTLLYPIKSIQHIRPSLQIPRWRFKLQLHHGDIQSGKWEN